MLAKRIWMNLEEIDNTQFVEKVKTAIYLTDSHSFISCREFHFGFEPL